MSIRKVALATFIAAVLGMLMPFWNAAQTMNGVVSTHPLWKWWMIPAMVLALVFSAIMPVFYLALYRNEEPLRFPKHLRPLSLSAALLLTIIRVIRLSTWATAREDAVKSRHDRYLTPQTDLRDLPGRLEQDVAGQVKGHQ